EAAYRTPQEMIADLEADPLVGTARLLVERGFCTPDEVIERYEAARDRVLTAAEGVLHEPRLGTTRQVMEPFAALDEAAVASRVGLAGSPPEPPAAVAAGAPAQP